MARAINTAGVLASWGTHSYFLFDGPRLFVRSASTSPRTLQYIYCLSMWTWDWEDTSIQGRGGGSYSVTANKGSGARLHVKGLIRASEDKRRACINLSCGDDQFLREPHETSKRGERRKADVLPFSRWQFQDHQNIAWKKQLQTGNRCSTRWEGRVDKHLFGGWWILPAITIY